MILSWDGLLVGLKGMGYAADWVRDGEAKLGTRS
jgi:hypothetical protein